MLDRMCDKNESFIIQNYLVSVDFHQLGQDKMFNRGVGPNLTLKKTQEFNDVLIRKPEVGDKILVVSFTGLGPIKFKTIISSILGYYLIIDMPKLISSGIILTIDELRIIGFVSPIKLKQNFLVGITLKNILPSFTTINPNPTIYPVFLISSKMTGSAVSLSSNLLITNAHVVQNSLDCKIHQINTLGKVIKKGKVLDLALIQCEHTGLIPKLAKTFYEGEEVYSAGFGLFKLNNLLVTCGYLSKIIYHQGFPVIAMISCKTFNGQSGGGIFNAKNELVGIITANAQNQNDRIYEDLGFCILNTMFFQFSNENFIEDLKFPYQWNEESQEFSDLFSFQTTSYLPYPKL